tara:strand:+ start:251 stop:1447 length:1197 start_codon:yes stop_codon:yes gene_type:complete
MLFTPEAVRERCKEIFRHGLKSELPWFSINLDGLSEATERVLLEINTNYPDSKIPFHSRWRHFEINKTNLWDLAAREANIATIERLISAGDLAIISVLLDAGAGSEWSYKDKETGLVLPRSEGLAIASFRLFQSGLLSNDSDQPYRVDGQALISLNTKYLAEEMQSRENNQLLGIDSRANLLRNLGEEIQKNPEVFEYRGTVRPGNLLLRLADIQNLRTRDILISVLKNLSGIWPTRFQMGNYKLGDVWKHSCIIRPDPTNHFVPFHKLSQWLSYSLIEPLQIAGSRVLELGDLTGLAEYRNGGLFIDTGTIVPKTAEILKKEYLPHEEIIVEWRALTVALLDVLAERVREALGRSVEELPLASILEGGTWKAGRKIAAEKRKNGVPPIQVTSDATVF